MGLLNDIKQEKKVAPVAAVATEKDEKKKEKKAAKKAALAKIIAFAKEHGDEEVKKAAELLTPRAGGFVAGGPNLFERMFPNAKVGDKVSAMDMLKRINKNFGQVRKLIEKWGKEGKVVEYDESTYTYTLKAL